jgi:hypothetical protein
MDERLKTIAQGFKDHYSSEENGEISNASVRLLGDCTTATSAPDSEPASDASTGAESNDGNTKVPSTKDLESKSRRLNDQYVRVEVEVDVDVKGLLTEDKKDEFNKKTEAIKAKLSELGAWEDETHKEKLPEWFAEKFDFARGPILLSPELSVCEIVDAAQLEWSGKDGLQQQYRDLKEDLEALKKAAEDDDVKGWFSRTWQSVKDKVSGWFGNAKSELLQKAAQLEELKQKIAKTVDAAQQAIKNALGSSDYTPASDKQLRRLKEVRRLSEMVPTKDNIILI